MPVWRHFASQKESRLSGFFQDDGNLGIRLRSPNVKDDGRVRFERARRAKRMRFFMKTSGVIAASTSLALAGCMAHESDEPMGEAAQAFELGLATVTCNSGWPGSRGCFQRLGDGREIVPGTVTVQVDGRGSIGHSAALVENNRFIDFSASIHEGDAFNPGKNTTRFAVAWLYK
jgi:hypothetical protein